MNRYGFLKQLKGAAFVITGDVIVDAVIGVCQYGCVYCTVCI